MYSTESNSQNYSDSKYAVADILSSMANGAPAQTYINVEPAVSYVTGISTGTTPTLTPTTLANLEQAFINLESNQEVNTTIDLSRQSGFVPPVVDPVVTSSSMTKSDYMYSGDSSDNDPDWQPSPAKQPRMTSVIRQNTSYMQNANSNGLVSSSTSTTPRKGGRKPKNDMLTPEEYARKKVRRERNKLAAAKCRQRRVDHTNELIDETESLEEEKSSLETEIQSLRQQKEQLEFLLEAHKPMCSHSDKINMERTETTMATTYTGDVIVKTEPIMDENSLSNDSSNLGIVVTNPSVTVYTSAPMSMTPVASTGRPNSLPIRTLPQATVVSSSASATGIAITTPSRGVFTLGLDSMADGHTGLTPLTGVPSCANEVHRQSSDSSPNDTLASPTTLMAL